MKKKTLFGLFIFAFCFFSFAKEVQDISDKRAIILVNYLQYSLAQIKEHPDNKIVANHEFDLIINNINTSTLKDPYIIDAYSNMLKSLTSLKLTANEKKYAEVLAARERKNAIYNIFNSAGSVFVPGQNPLLSLAYASVNAGLNYAGAIKQAEASKEDDDFRISQDLLIAVDDARIDLHDKTARSFSFRDDTNLLISESLMESFAKALSIDATETREHTLQMLDESFEMFPPYWFALGYTKHKNGKYEEALKSYEKYDAILNDEMVLNYDEISSQVYLSMIDIFIKLDREKYNTSINECINKINTQIKKAPTDSQKQLVYALACVYKMIGDEKKSNVEFSMLAKYGDENWTNTTKSLEYVLSGNLSEVLNGNIEETKIDETKSKVTKKDLLIALILVIVFNIIFYFALLISGCPRGFAIFLQILCLLVLFIMYLIMYLFFHSIGICLIFLIYLNIVCFTFSLISLFAFSVLNFFLIFLFGIAAYVIPYIIYFINSNTSILLVSMILSIIVFSIFSILVSKIFECEKEIDIAKNADDRIMAFKYSDEYAKFIKLKEKLLGKQEPEKNSQKKKK